MTTEALALRRFSQQALDVLFDRLSVQTMPVGSYEGHAWMPGHPLLGWLAGWVWRGKVFKESRVKNRILRLLLFAGDVSLVAFDSQDSADHWVWLKGDEISIEYPQLGLRDRVRQVSPSLYLGRLLVCGVVVNFTLSQEEKG